MIFWAGVLVGAAAAAVALYGRYRVLPAWLTGPTVCKLDAGGCEVLFRSAEAALLGVPNSVLGLAYYPALALGRALGWPPLLLFAGASLAFGMSVRLAYFLLSERLECRVCWIGHACNTTLWLLLLLEVLGAH